MKVVIIGGVAGGATAAARLRRLDEQAEIVVFERSGYVSYANCGLPYYIGEVIEDPEALTLQTPESFFARFRVDMRENNDRNINNIDANAIRADGVTNPKSDYSEKIQKYYLPIGYK